VIRSPTGGNFRRVFDLALWIGKASWIVIKIRYADLPEGLHVDVKSEGSKTIIYLLPALSRAQRHAAFTKARQAARVGRTPRLPWIALMLAVAADRFKITLRACAAAARVHPVGFAVPAAIFVTAVILYTFVTSVTISLSPPHAAGPGPGPAQSVAGSQAAPGSPLPSPGEARSSGTGGGSRAGHTGPAGPSGGSTGSAGSGGSAQTGQPGSGTSGQSVTASPMSAPAPSSAGSGSGSGSGSAPSPTQSPAPAPSPSSSANSGLCVQVGLLKVCAHLP